MSKPDERLQARGGDMDARVKPLVWVEEPDRDANYPKWVADTGMGKSYFVFKAWWGSREKWGFAGIDGFYDTKEAAKAAAQADYEARILAALEPAPDLAELVEAATAMLDRHVLYCGGPDLPFGGYTDRALFDRLAAALAKIKE